MNQLNIKKRYFSDAATSPQVHLMIVINIAFLIISLIFFTHDFYFIYLVNGKFNPDVWRLVIQFAIGCLGLLLVVKENLKFVAFQTSLTPALIYFIMPAFIPIDIEEAYYINSLVLPASIAIPIMVFKVKENSFIINSICLLIIISNFISEYYMIFEKGEVSDSFENFYIGHFLVLYLAKIAACLFFYFTFMTLFKRNEDYEISILERNKLLELSNNVVKFQKEEIEIQNKKLEKTHQELNRINKNLAIIIRERTKEIESKNKKMVEYAYLNSHVLRGPFARLKGLINLIQITDDLSLREEYLGYLKTTLEELDAVIEMITKILHDEAPDQLSRIQERVQNLYAEFESEN